jgi:DNA-binding MarR family transcriptional regulator
MKNEKVTMSPPTQHSFRVAEIESTFETHYLNYQYIFVQFLIDHLTDVGRAFKGDYQAMLVLAVIGQARLQATKTALQKGADLQLLTPEKESSNASRISDVTGIPRQTVRRKLADLAERGWIERNADGSYRLQYSEGQSNARRELSEIDRRAIARVARLFKDLEDLVKRHDTLIEKSR